MLDRKKIGIVPGIALSFLKKEEQEWVTDILLEEKIKLQTKEAEECKEQSQKGLLTQNGVKEILCCKKVKIDKPFKFIATVKNYEKTVGPEYTVELRDWNENLIDSDDEPALEGRTENEVYLYAVLEESQVRDGAIGFYATIKPKESGWTDTSDGDEWYRTKIHISADGDDGFNTKKTISLDEHITGQIDQDSDDDYYYLYFLSCNSLLHI